MYRQRKTAGMQPAAQAGMITQKSIQLDYITPRQNAQTFNLKNSLKLGGGW